MGMTATMIGRGNSLVKAERFLNQIAEFEKDEPK